MAKRKKRAKKKDRGITKQIIRHKELRKKYKDDPKKQHTVSYWDKEIKAKFSKQAKKARTILSEKKEKRSSLHKSRCFHLLFVQGRFWVLTAVSSSEWACSALHRISPRVG